MNTDALLQLKREFQILVEQMKIVFCPKDGIQQRAHDLLQFKVPLQNLQSRLQAEKENHANFGDLDKLEILWADERTKQKWYQKRERQEQLLERLLIHDNLLLCFCDFIRYHSHQEALNPTSLLHHLGEFIAVDIRRYTHFPYLEIAYEGVETLTSEIEQFIGALKKRLNPGEKQKQKRLYAILLELEEYRSIIQPQAELFSREKAEFEREKQRWYQQQEELKRQQEAWLEEEKAKLRQQQARLEEEKAAPQRQQPTLLQPPIQTASSVKADSILDKKIDKKSDKNRRRFGWSPLLLLAFVIGILGGVQFLPKASVNSRERMNFLAENQQPLELRELRLKSAQALAMEASEAVENQPLGLTAWQEARGKWEDAIAVLEEMPISQVRSEPVQKQLAIYQEDYNWANQKLIREQTAIANFNSAKKLALQASVLVNNPPYPLEVWREAENKWQAAINVLETIPNDTFIAPQVQEKIELYRLNLQEIEKRIMNYE